MAALWVRRASYYCFVFHDRWSGWEHVEGKCWGSGHILNLCKRFRMKETQPAVCRGLSWLQLVLSDFSHSSINKDQFQRKKNDTLDPELYVALLHSFESHYCVKSSRGIKRVISSDVIFFHCTNFWTSVFCLLALRLVECIDCGRKMHQICVLHNETIWPSGWASYHRHTRKHTHALCTMHCVTRSGI